MSDNETAAEERWNESAEKDEKKYYGLFVFVLDFFFLFLSITFISLSNCFHTIKVDFSFIVYKLIWLPIFWIQFKTVQSGGYI